MDFNDTKDEAEFRAEANVFLNQPFDFIFLGGIVAK